MNSHHLVGTSAVVRSLVAECESIATSQSKVLISGESGVGKEVFAHYIHSRSRRKQAPMVSINCAGVPESLLESELFGHVRGSFTDAHRDRTGILQSAHRGTVLLDEIGEMGLRMQTLLLRFLETGEIQRVGADQPEKPLDVRLIAATNRNLWEETRKKTFREDLYYRLNVVHLVVPPLRDRREDIKPLLVHFLDHASTLEGRPVPEFTAEALAYLERYRWPGNVRELKNVAERLVVGHQGRPVRLDDLPAEILAEETNLQVAGSLSPWQQLIDECHDRMTIGGESFWATVYEPFLRRDLTREAVRAIVRRGLQQTRGSYPLLVAQFNLPEEDCRKFMRFLHKHDCHLPIHQFRMLRDAVEPAEQVAVVGGGAAEPLSSQWCERCPAEVSTSCFGHVGGDHLPDDGPPGPACSIAASGPRLSGLQKADTSADIGAPSESSQRSLHGLPLTEAYARTN